MEYPMKYTICGFSQEKLFEYQLDINDAMILRWLIDFAATGKMKKLIENNLIYYLVNYEAIICAFPIMGITSTKAIANRFEKYVKAGLLEKTIKKGGSYSGTATLFAITSLVGDMIYDSEKPQNREKTEIKIFDKNQTSCRTEEKVDDSESDKNQTSYRDKNQTSYRDKNQTSCPTGTQLPVALKNSSVNSSDINSSSRQKEQEAEETVLKKALDCYVDTHAFSDDLIPHLVYKLREFDIHPDKYQDFVDFAYAECSKKVRDKSRLMAYIYKSISDNYLISQFLQFKRAEEEKKVELENQMIICPVCGRKHHYADTCFCGLKNYRNQLEIDFFRKIYQLPPEVKKKLQSELDTISAECGLDFTPAKIAKLKSQKESVYYKYIKFPHEEYIKIFG